MRLRSGYGFVSYRLGSLMWMRENGRIVLKRFSLAGTGGQCLMSPPGGPDGDFPLMMYNFGGAAVNLATAALLGALTAIPGVRGSIVFLPLCLFGGLSALYLAAVNGIPLVLGPVPNDGWNALHLAADPQARRAFWVTLKVNELQHRGVRLKDMSAEWFALPSEEAMKNGKPALAATGNEHINNNLSHRRADYIKSLMVQRGIDESFITTAYEGGINEYSPVQANRQTCVTLSF